MYKCKGNKHVRVSISNVCDKHVDCPDGDDEFHCMLRAIACPSNCFCLIFSITCSRTSPNLIFFKMNVVFISVYIFNSNLSSLHRLNMKLDLTYVIKLPRNNIEIYCPIPFFRNVLILDLGYNSLKEIKQKCFSELRFLVHIGMNNNHILYLRTFSFYNFINLCFLNLSNKPLINLPSNCFISTKNLKMMVFRNIKFDNIEDQPFTSVGVKIIATDDYRASCTIPKNAFCSFYPPWYLSCSDILPSTPLKVIGSTVSVFIIIINSLSIVLQIISCKENKTFSLIVIAINFNDLICGLYLCNIWVSDIMFQGTYLIKEEIWKSHPLCFIAFFLIFYFSFVGLFLLLFLSVSRLMVVLDPVDTKFKSFKLVTHNLACIFCCSDHNHFNIYNIHSERKCNFN